MSVSNETDGLVSPHEVSKQIKLLIKEIPEARADAARLDELRRVFAKLESSGELEFGCPLPKNPVAAKWRSFLLKHHKLMVSQLCERVTQGRHTAIRCLWGVLASSPAKSISGNSKHLNVEILQKWLKAVTCQESEGMDRGMRHMISSEFLHAYRDVQYFSLGSIRNLAIEEYDKKGSEVSSGVAEKLLDLLMMVPVPESAEEMEVCEYLCPPSQNRMLEMEGENDDDDDDHQKDEDTAESDDEISDDDKNPGQPEGTHPNKRRKIQQTGARSRAFQQVGSFRRQYQKAWLAVLKLSLPGSSLKRALSFLPKDAFDNVPSPLRFSDFFMQAFSDHGSGIIGVLALDGLFLLITEHGLEYKHFYKQLYRLVSPRVMYAKYRSRFYNLLTRCLLLNDMLPGHVVAAFAKRLCHSALSGPPSGSLFVLALVSNLIRKHPEVACLVHRDVEEAYQDQFDPKENDPVKSRALQSSLWELSVLERHYHPAVRTLAKSVGSLEELSMPLHDVGAFSNHTYKSLFDQERKRKPKKTALTFKEPLSLFASDDIFSGIIRTES